MLKNRYKRAETIFFKSRSSFRSWLKENYDQSQGIWVIFYKKHVKKECVSYKEALKEALCFGWIDSTLKRIDDDQYVRIFTPRKNTKQWSDVNKRIVVTLIKEGRMTEAGLMKIDEYLKTGKVNWKNEDINTPNTTELAIPDFIIEAFANNEPALTNFNKLAPSFKKQYVGWIISAKKKATIQKRLKEAIDLLEQNQKLGMK